MKLVMSCALEFKVTGGNLYNSFKENIFDHPTDCLKISVPALLYLVQNSLLYVALSNLSAPLFQVTYQSKLLTTAVVSVIMLNRRYSVKQWICLASLGLGVAIVVLGAKSDDKKEDKNEALENEDKPTQSLFLGLVCVTISCLCSALAGVYFEKVLKKVDKGSSRAPVSLWMRNIQLAFFSVCIAIAQLFFMTGKDSEKTFMHGFTGWVWAVVLLQAGGGLLVAAVIKYADNVLKGMATGVSVVVSTGMSMVLFGTPVTFQFAVGAIIILSSVYLFSNEFPGFKSWKKEGSRNENNEVKPLVVDKV